MTDHELLGIATGATRDALKAHWREVARQHHPDHGGDPERFMDLHAAYRRLLAKASKCARCNDTGKVDSTMGFRTITMACRCKGGAG